MTIILHRRRRFNWQVFLMAMLGILELACTFPLPILFALLINELRSSAFRRVAQTATYFPHFISWVVYGGIVTAFLSSDGGFINNVLMALGGNPEAGQLHVGGQRVCQRPRVRQRF